MKGQVFVCGGGKPVAYYAGGAAHFEHQDWLGTERIRTSYNGAVEGSFTSLPFGDGQGTTGADTDANHYAMLDHDTETDTDHAQFRQYSNMQGRWLSPDPYSGSYQLRKPQSFNRYTYAGNNPLAAVDPSGLDDNQITCSPNGDGTYNCSGGGFMWTEYIVSLNGVDTWTATGVTQTFSQWVGVDIYGNVLDTERLDPRSFGSSVGSYQPTNDGGAPNNAYTDDVAKKLQQHCLDNFNNSGGGAVVNFFSMASPFIGPDRLDSAIEDVGGTGLKIAAYDFFKAASKSMVRTPFGSMSGLVAGSMKTVAAKVVLPAAYTATAVQVGVHLGCYLAFN